MRTITQVFRGILFALVVGGAAFGDVIEKQLVEIGSISDEEVVVVQRKYTRKLWRHELTPIGFGGLPFGTVRRTLFGGAGYTLHFNDWLGWEALNFVYTKTFFSTFTDDINNNKLTGANQVDIKPDFQKLLFFLTTGVVLTPFYGKLSSLSRWIAYTEPFVSLGFGISKTETDSYVAVAPGIGLRVFYREWFSMKIEFRDYIYNEKAIDRVTSAPRTLLRHNYAVMGSLSFWLPKMP